MYSSNQKTRRRGQQGNGRPGSYKSGDHYIICDRSGFKILRSTAKRTWDHLVVRSEDFEPRNVQDFVKGRKDKQHVDDPRSELTNVFLDTNDVSASDL